jgi:hypothetical protein
LSVFRLASPLAPLSPLACLLSPHCCPLPPDPRQLLYAKQTQFFLIIQ